MKGPGLCATRAWLGDGGPGAEPPGSTRAIDRERGVRPERASRTAAEGSEVERAPRRAAWATRRRSTAVANLAGNARKHAGNGAAIGVRIESRPEAAPPEVAVVVWDRGPGIHPDDRERLFEPFFRGRNAREGQTAGSGLGLAVVRRIAESLGGRVEVQSAPGQGASFALILQAAPAAPGKASDV